MQEFTVEPDSAGVRADIFVASRYPEFTRSSLELLFDKGLVAVNGKTAKRAHKVQPDDKVVVDEQYLKTEPPKIKLPIIYEDKDVLVIDKPAGTLTHSKGALNFEATVASFIKDKLDEEIKHGNRAGIVHRLDRATSGVIIVAKNYETLKKLQKQFSQRKAKKSYLAVVEGVPSPETAIIDAPIARNPAKPQTFRVSGSGRGAVTQYQLVRTLKKGSRVYSLIELIPKTGRTHQLRVHMAYIKHPIVGDPVYGHNGNDLMLHAGSLEITLPNGERKTFHSPLPSRIKEFTDVQ